MDVFRSDIHEEMPFADVNRAHNFPWQTCLAENFGEDIFRPDAHFLAGVNEKSRLFVRGSAAMPGSGCGTRSGQLAAWRNPGLMPLVADAFRSWFGRRFL